MILWPTVAPALLPSRCGRSDGAQDMAFAEVFALCAGVPLSGDETSPEAKIAEPAGGAEDALMPTVVPFLTLPVGTVPEQVNKEAGTIHEPGGETPLPTTAGVEGDAFLPADDLRLTWSSDRGGMDAPGMSDAPLPQSGQTQAEPQYPIAEPLPHPLRAAVGEAISSQPTAKVTGPDSRQGAAVLPTNMPDTQQTLPANGGRAERHSSPPPVTQAEGGTTGQPETGEAPHLSLVAPPLGNGQAQADARPARDIRHGPMPDPDAPPPAIIGSDSPPQVPPPDLLEPTDATPTRRQARPTSAAGHVEGWSSSVRFTSGQVTVSAPSLPVSASAPVLAPDRSSLPPGGAGAESNGTAWNQPNADQAESRLASGTAPTLTPAVFAGPSPAPPPALAEASTTASPGAASLDSTRAILRQITVRGGTGDAAMEIALFPKELGRIHLHIQQGPEGARISVTAERAETAALIRHHAAELAQEFRSTGMTNPLVTVQSGDQSRDIKGDATATAAPSGQTPAQAEGGQSGQMTSNHGGDRPGRQPGSHLFRLPDPQALPPAESPALNPQPSLRSLPDGGLILRL